MLYMHFSNRNKRATIIVHWKTRGVRDDESKANF